MCAPAGPVGHRIAHSGSAGGGCFGWFGGGVCPPPGFGSAGGAPAGCMGKAGIHAISIESLGIKLEEGADYEWNVALIPNPLQGSLDITSTGGIRRIAAKEQMKDFNDYGKNGIWYDRLHDLSTRLEADPTNAKLLKERGDLFKQVGLPEVAELDYSQIKTKG